MIEPQIIRKKRPILKQCSHCNTSRAGDDFILTKSWFYNDGLAPICNSCIKERMIKLEWSWGAINKLCQMLDIPFIPNEFERLHDINGDDVFPIYARVLSEQPFEDLGWDDYFEKFKELKLLKLINNELPEIHDAHINELRLDWGKNYDEESLLYLNNLYNGMLTSQNINGSLQIDQARKLCKMSLVIDEKIRAGEPIDKDMSSYDKMVKTAEFTPKNSKNENDFNSFAEVGVWLERRGWLNEYYDDVKQDVVDEVLQNMQTFNQRLYTNEPSIAEEIESRIQALKIANMEEHVEDYFDLNKEYNIEGYDNDGYNQLIKEEFIIDDDDE